MMNERTKPQQPQGTDSEIVIEALTLFHSMSQATSMPRGMGYRLQLARAALAAFERLWAQWPEVRG